MDTGTKNGRASVSETGGVAQQDSPPGVLPEVEIYTYPEAPWIGDIPQWAAAFGRTSMEADWIDSPAASGCASEVADAVDSGPQSGQAAANAEVNEAQWAARLADERHWAEERGRREGMEAGLARGREEALRSIAAERERLHAQGRSIVESFAEEKDRYFRRMEQEAARLALAIASRILRREAQMDALLLTGAVRVALGQLAQSTSVRLHVPLQDKPLWEEALTRMPKLENRPAVVGDAEMQLGDCRLETELGSADLSLWEQLKEIERGFFDRPGSGSHADSAPDAEESGHRPSRGGRNRHPESDAERSSGAAPQSGKEELFRSKAYGDPPPVRVPQAEDGEETGREFLRSGAGDSAEREW